MFHGMWRFRMMSRVMLNLKQPVSPESSSVRQLRLVVLILRTSHYIATTWQLDDISSN
jgi:hypothetical protein